MVSVNTGGGICLGDGRDTIVATLGGASAISLIGDSSAAAADVITLTGVTVKAPLRVLVVLTQSPSVIPWA